MINLVGDWNGYYRYSSSERGEDFWGQHLLHARQEGNKLTLETAPDSPAYQFVELELSPDGKTARGVWTESDPHAYSKGWRYEGTTELQIAANGERMSGIWHGAGRDGTLRSDVWELVRIETVQYASKRPSRWLLKHWYPSADDSIEEFDEHVMTAHWSKDTVVLESKAKEGKSYMLARLLIQGDIARGGWRESALPDGEFKGAEYTGAGELVVDPDTLHMEGMWAGAGYDHTLKKTRIYTGKWEVTPLDEE